jgi:hypothetical protein
MTSANGAKPLLGRDAILKATALPTEDVYVPFWGGTVRLRGLTGKGRDEYEASNMVWRDGRAYPDTANTRAKLVARCAVDEEGEPLFTQQDADALGELPGRELNLLWERALALSGLTEEDAEELAGNSPAAPSGGSTSGSRSRSAAPSKIS